MTFKQVNRLWWAQSWHWLLGFMAIMLLIGLGTAVKTTQQHVQNTHEPATMHAQQVEEYRKHPEDFQLDGHQVSLSAYNSEQNQIFPKNQFKLHSYMLRAEVPSNNWLYLVMAVAGLILAFWGRRTHYTELMLSLGVTRTQLFLTQLLQSLALTATVAVAQLLHWTWIIMVVPKNYQIYRDLPGLFGNNVAIVTISFGLLALGWLMGQLTDRFWLAGLLAALSWRFMNGVASSYGYAAFFFGQSVIPPEFWFYAHAYVASAVSAGLALIAVGLIWRLSVTWSAEQSVFTRQSGLKKWAMIAVMTIAGGALVGDVLFQPFAKSGLPWFELLGMAVLCIGLLGGLTYQQHRSKEAHYDAS